MKTLVSILGFFLLVSFTQAQQDHSTPASGEENTSSIAMAWNETIHDFMEVPVGTPVKATFEFTNTGKEPITITRVKSSCGCTVAGYSKEPVLPGKTGEVSATYNAARAGNFNKAITVYMNDNQSQRLSVKGQVKNKEL